MSGSHQSSNSSESSPTTSRTPRINTAPTIPNAMSPILSAPLMEMWERCPRMFRWMESYEPHIISPLNLLYRGIETALTSEKSAEETVHNLGATHTLHLPDRVQPYTVIRHIASLATILSHHLKSRLGELKTVPPIDCGEYAWQPSCFRDRGGKLHRIALVDTWDDDRLSYEAHSWRTVGDIAFLERGMTLNILVIGVSRLGRRHSPFSKAYRHPQNKQLRFGRRNEKHAGFEASWEQIWREDHPQISLDSWLSTMDADNVLSEHSFQIPVQPKARDYRVEQVKTDIQTALRKMDGEPEMRRTSCDWPKPCPFQVVCYSPIPVTPADLPGAFLPR